jgi:hypothetical protein
LEINERKLGRPQIQSGRGNQANGRNFLREKIWLFGWTRSASMEMNHVSMYAAFSDKQQFISRRSRGSVMKIRDALQILRRGTNRSLTSGTTIEKLVRSPTELIVTSAG